jgi:hypothetical protein
VGKGAQRRAHVKKDVGTRPAAALPTLHDYGFRGTMPIGVKV